jgi:hypothetical protein
MSIDLTSKEVTRIRKAKKYLRLFMMDTAELNRLLRREEMDDEHLELALMLVISDWNTTTPILARTTIGNFPSFYLLMHGATIQCLKMAGLYQSRNELTYSAGDSSFVRANKTQYYQSWLQNFASDYEAKKINYKIQINVETSYGGGFHSEYSLIGFDW